MKRPLQIDSGLSVDQRPPTSHDRQSWAWLDAAARALDFAVMIVDSHRRTAPPVGSRATATALTKLLSETDSIVSATISMAFGIDHGQRLSVESLVAVCNQLTVDGEAVGVLVIARATSGTSLEAREQSLNDIETIGHWVTPSVEAHLGRSADGAEAFDRVSSLHRLLHDAVEGGNEREIVTAFAEALLAWDGVATNGYVEDVQGQFSLAITSPGAARGHAVVNLESAAPPRWAAAPTLLTAADLDRFGLPLDRHAIAIEVGSEGLEPWLIVFSEGYRSLNASRLAIYADVLREALARVSTIVETRVTWSILQSLLGNTSAVETAVDAALQELSHALEGLGATLAVTSATGIPLLSVGEVPLAGARPFDRGNRLVSTSHLLDLGTMQLTIRRAPGQTFTRREQHLVDRAAAIFSAWLPGTLTRSAEGAEPRSANRSFERELDRAASQTLREGVDVSALVISIPDALSQPLLLHSWVTDIRAQLRGSDLAGTVSDQEIGVVLSGTAQADVPVVCARLRRRLGLDEGTISAEIGVASRASGTAVDDSIVAAARRNIASRRSTPISGLDAR